MGRARTTTGRRWQIGLRNGVGLTSRRLAFEAMESRLVLSGTQLDLDTWNLDSIQDHYAVITQADFAPAAPLNDVASFVQLDANGSIWSTVDHHAAFSGNGLFRAEFQNEHRVTIDVLRDAGWQAMLDGAFTAGGGPDRQVVRTVIADAATGHLQLPLPRWPSSGPYASLFEEHASASGPHYELLDTTPIDAQAAGSPASEAGQSGFAPSEGGEIPLERLVAEAGNVPTPRGSQLARPPANETPVAARSPAPTYVTGELARAVAFETIDGAAPPVAYAAAKGDAERPVIAAAAADEAIAPVQWEAMADAGPAQHLPLTPVLHDALAADELAVRLAELRLPITRDDMTPAPADAVVAQAFAELEDQTQDAERDRLDREEKSRLWLAGMPILAAVVAERLVAARRKSWRAEVRPPRRTAR